MHSRFIVARLRLKLNCLSSQESRHLQEMRSLLGRGTLVKIYVDQTGITFQAAKKSQPKVDEKGNQRTEKGTGRPMWSTQVIAIDETGGEVINVTTVGEIPSVEVGQFVVLDRLEAKAWATNGRNGTAYRAESVRPLASTPAHK
jgi:hypothetical protein